MPRLLQVRNVTKTFGGSFLAKGDVTVAVDDVTFSIEDDKPTMTAIAGESGSGKTTLALLMMGQIQPSSGSVLYRGRDLARMPSKERFQLRREVQPIFQDPFAAYNPFYRVDHVLEVPIKRFGLASSKAAAQKLIGEALETVGLRPAETLGRFPHELSGGQRQRLMVARALLCHPKVVMADEPVSMVDASLRATILASLRKLNRDLGISVVYITHDLTTAYQICENILVMYSGAVVEAGSVEQVIGKPKHPYTQLLISSIPVPGKHERWVGAVTEEAAAGAVRKSTGCKFAPRCPAQMEICWDHKPPLYIPDQDRAVACFLYQESHHLETPDVAQVLR